MAYFKVLGPSSRRIERFDEPYALKQDNWDDYGFKTQYHLYKFAGDKDSELIGPVKILRVGQTIGEAYLISDDFDQLPPDFVSIGTSFDYYQRLNRLSVEGRNHVLTSLNDVVLNPKFETFRSEPGWNTSLFRGIAREGQSKEEQDQYLSDTRAIIERKLTTVPDLNEPIGFLPAGWENGLEINFDAPAIPFLSLPSSFEGTRTPFPKRSAVLIGPNGSGKSTLLSRLARVAFASPSERQYDPISTLGELQPKGIGFFKIVSVSYSAFDSFSLPGTHIDELEQIANDADRGVGRFVFCGLRDIAKETREDIQTFLETQGDVPSSSSRRIPISLPERRSSVHLKSLDRLADEFVGFLSLIKRDGRFEQFETAMSYLLADQSFARLPERSVDALFKDDPKAAFLGWSTGHKIALHVIAALTAHADKRSLVLFDEPETHLHPPMIAAMMHAVRFILEEFDAMALIATHSPVVLQETLARHVRIIRQGGKGPRVYQPKSETFGENIGTLVHDTFGLRASDTNFHDLLDVLVALSDGIEEIEAKFEPALSAQARAYVLSKLPNENDRGEGRGT